MKRVARSMGHRCVELLRGVAALAAPACVCVCVACSAARLCTYFCRQGA
jgi:hypothetical protein